jgi:methylphosphotriester-DNA--protein-cysteine methyltransferase
MKFALSILVLLFLFSSCGPKFDDNVVVIEKTRTCHRPTCTQVAMARTKVETRAQARAEGFRPCPYCKPDTDLAGRPDQSR